MLFPLLSLSLIALSPTFYESFANANSATLSTSLILEFIVMSAPLQKF